MQKPHARRPVQSAPDESVCPFLLLGPFSDQVVCPFLLLGPCLLREPRDSGPARGPLAIGRPTPSNEGGENASLDCSRLDTALSEQDPSAYFCSLDLPSMSDESCCGLDSSSKAGPAGAAVNDCAAGSPSRELCGFGCRVLSASSRMARRVAWRSKR